MEDPHTAGVMSFYHAFKLSFGLVAIAVGASSFGQAVYTQAPNLSAGADGGAFSRLDQIVADSFVPTSTSNFTSLEAWGSYFFTGSPYATGTTQPMQVRFYGNTGSIPNTNNLLYSATLTATLTQTSTFVTDFGNDRLYKFSLDITGSPVFNAGTTYWLAFHAPNTTTDFRWFTSNTGPGSAAAFTQNQGIN
jgi:hypothetical protein